MPLNLGGSSLSIANYSISLSFASTSSLANTSLWTVTSGAESAAQDKPAKRDGQKSRMTGRASQGAGANAEAQGEAEEEEEQVLPEVKVTPAPEPKLSEPTFSMDAYKEQEWKEFKELWLYANQFNPIGPLEVMAAIKLKAVLSAGIIAAKEKIFSRMPKSLMDKMVLEAAKRGEGKKIVDKLGDPKFKGMEKWSYGETSAAGKRSEVHYVRDPATGELMDFKFKHHASP